MRPFRKPYENLAKPPGGYAEVEICTVRRYKPSGMLPSLYARVTEPHQCDPDYEIEHGCPTGPVEIGVFGRIDKEEPRLLFISDTPECAYEALLLLGIIPPHVRAADERKTLGGHVTLAERTGADTHAVVAAFNKPKRVTNERFSLAVELTRVLLSPAAEVLERQDLPTTLDDILPNNDASITIDPSSK
jgi:hypothetical protein